jgi:hypothetical protein
MSNSNVNTVTDIVYSLSNIKDALVPSPIQGVMQLPLTHIKVKLSDWEEYKSHNPKFKTHIQPGNISVENGRFQEKRNGYP